MSISRYRQGNPTFYNRPTHKEIDWNLSLNRGLIHVITPDNGLFDLVAKVPFTYSIAPQAMQRTPRGWGFKGLGSGVQFGSYPTNTFNFGRASTKFLTILMYMNPTNTAGGAGGGGIINFKISTTSNGGVTCTTGDNGTSTAGQAGAYGTLLRDSGSSSFAAMNSGNGAILTTPVDGLFHSFIWTLAPGTGSTGFNPPSNLYFDGQFNNTTQFASAGGYSLPVNTQGTIQLFTGTANNIFAYIYIWNRILTQTEINLVGLYPYVIFKNPGVFRNFGRSGGQIANTITRNLSLFIGNIGQLNSAIPLFQDGNTNITNSISLFTGANSFASRSISQFINGNHLSSEGVSLYVLCNDNTILYTPLTVIGQDILSRAVPLDIAALDINIDNISLFLEGFFSQSQSIPLLVTGNDSYFHGVPLYILGVRSGVNISEVICVDAHIAREIVSNTYLLRQFMKDYKVL